MARVLHAEYHPFDRARAAAAAAILGGMPDRPEPHEDLDPDEVSRRAAVRTVARRALAWLVPLVAVGALLVGLGLPALLVVPVLVVAWIVVVFELDI